MDRRAIIFHSRRQERARICAALAEHFEPIEIETPDELHQSLSADPPALVLTELTLPQRKGLALVAQVRELAPASELLVVSPVESPACAVAAVKAGAFGFLTKRDDEDAILNAAYEALEHRAQRQQKHVREAASLPASDNEEMRRLLDAMPDIAKAAGHAVIAGEIGTGRKILARGLHNLSPRPGVLRLADCTRATQEPLLATLGIELAEASPADSEREPINNSLCLLNLEQLPQRELPTLARLCEGPVSVRLHDGSIVPVRHRLIGVCALEHRSDDSPAILRRLCAAPFAATLLHVPPLRHRTDDLPSLCVELAEKHGGQYGVVPKRFAPDALEVFATYAWPANTLELSNLIERLTLTVPEPVIDVATIPLELHINTWKRGLTYRDAMEHLERQFLTRILERTGGCRRRAAERLQLSYSTLKFRLRKLALGGYRKTAAH